MKKAPWEGFGPPREGMLRRLGDSLLRFAGEDRSLDRDALYELWSEADSRCWMDTEQEKRQMPLRGLPEGVHPVVGDGPAVPPHDGQVANDSGFAPSSGWGDDRIQAFQTEIDHWRRQRSLAKVPVEVRLRLLRNRRTR